MRHFVEATTAASISKNFLLLVTCATVRKILVVVLAPCKTAAKWRGPDHGKQSWIQTGR